jgi:hypothetical protein
MASAAASAPVAGRSELESDDLESDELLPELESVEPLSTVPLPESSEPLSPLVEASTTTVPCMFGWGVQM